MVAIHLFTISKLKAKDKLGKICLLYIICIHNMKYMTDQALISLKIKDKKNDLFIFH